MKVFQFQVSVGFKRDGLVAGPANLCLQHCVNDEAFVSKNTSSQGSCKGDFSVLVLLEAD